MKKKTKEKTALITNFLNTSYIHFFYFNILLDEYLKPFHVVI